MSIFSSCYYLEIKQNWKKIILNEKKIMEKTFLLWRKTLRRFWIKIRVTSHIQSSLTISEARSSKDDELEISSSSSCSTIFLKINKLGQGINTGVRMNRRPEVRSTSTFRTTSTKLGRFGEFVCPRRPCSGGCVCEWERERKSVCVLWFNESVLS